MASYESADRGRIIRIVKHTKNYVVIQRQSIVDNRLSHRATGLLCHLLAMPDDWVVRIAHLVNAKTEGRNAVRKALSELKQCGYYRKYRRRDSRGRFFWVDAVYETPDRRAEYEQPELFEEFMQTIAPGSQAAGDASGTLFESTDKASKPTLADPQSIDGKPARGLNTRRAEGRFPALGVPGGDSTDGIPAHGEPSAENQTVPSNDVTSSDQQQQRAAAELITALTDAGIGEPVRSELANTGRLTATTVRREASKCRERGKGTGALVNNLRAIATRSRSQSTGSNAPALTNELPDQRAADEEYRTEAAAIDEWLIGLDDDERERLTAETLDAMSNAARRRLPYEDPRQSKALARRMYAAIHQPA